MTYTELTPSQMQEIEHDLQKVSFDNVRSTKDILRARQQHSSASIQIHPETLSRLKERHPTQNMNDIVNHALEQYLLTH